WVSRSGLDTNTCIITAPCLTFAGALGKTRAGGTINCLDAGDFGGGGFTIDESITIDCTGVPAALSVTVGWDGIDINVSHTDVVRLCGLSIEGAGGLAGDGVSVEEVGALHIEQCKIFGFSNYGINFGLASGASGELYVSDSVLSENGIYGI